MKASATVTTLLLGFTLGFPGSGLADSEEVEARRYEHTMLKAQELRAEAERIRSEAAEQGRTETAHPKAKALDQQADSIVEKARRTEPAEWPPSE
ncbi:MAG: hypothetical protein ACREQY_08200 [Candidatus Binatia bacterium]